MHCPGPTPLIVPGTTQRRLARRLWCCGGLLAGLSWATPAESARADSTGYDADVVTSASPAKTSAGKARAPACQRVTPTTAAGYQRMFDAKNDWTWSGGDQAATVRLPDGRTLWLFADTIQGRETRTGGYAAGWRMVHNSFVLQDRGCLRGVTGPNGGEVIPNPTRSTFYWPQSGVVTGGRLVVFSLRVRRTGTGPLDFVAVGTDAAVFSLPTSRAAAPKLLRVVPTPASSTPESRPAWGQAVVADGGYLYVYGSAKVTGELVFGKAVHLARVPAGELLTPSAWQYWDGEGWSVSAADSRHIVAAEPAGWSTSFTVARTEDGLFQMLTKENEFLGTDVITGFSEVPTGPFTRRLVAKYPTLNTTPKQVFYTALSHPHLKVSAGILGHICRNTFSSSLAAVGRDADRYKPQFFPVPTGG